MPVTMTVTRKTRYMPPHLVTSLLLTMKISVTALLLTMKISVTALILFITVDKVKFFCQQPINPFRAQLFPINDFN